MKNYLGVYFILLISVWLYGCTTQKKPTCFMGTAMTINYCVQIGDVLTQQDTIAIEEAILSTFVDIHAIYNNWNPDSEISKLNCLAAMQKAPISKELESFLNYVGHLVAKTENRFDPTVAPLVNLWKTCLKESTLPTQAQIDALAGAIGWDKIHLDNGYFWKEHPLTALDCGGVAKGYAVDLLTQKIVNMGYTQVYVEWGGEIRTYGQHPERRHWKIGIKGSDVIELVDESIATSGSYLQNWTVNDVNYTHIIDPYTRQPSHSNSISSVSVIAPSCAEADALATALMLFPSKEQALSWAQKREMRVFIW